MPLNRSGDQIRIRQHLILVPPHSSVFSQSDRHVVLLKGGSNSKGRLARPHIKRQNAEIVYGKKGF
jgi:hypothetical protein